jgi:tol-pal system protein YbgF
MSSTARIILTGALLLASADALALFGNQDLERRLTLLEQRLGGANQADLVIQVEQLRAEIQQLRGELEIQQHALDALRRRQQDMFSELGQAAPGVAPASAPTMPPAALPSQAPAAQAEPSAPGQGGPIIQSKTADPHQEAAYKTAFEQLKSGQYKTARESLRSFLDAYPTGAYADNAQYWLGEAYYVQRQYEQALAEFDKVVQRYPNSPKVADALLKMAYIESDRANGQKATDLLNRLISQHPDSTAAGLGKKQLERLRAQGN